MDSKEKDVSTLQEKERKTYFKQEIHFGYEANAKLNIKPVLLNMPSVFKESTFV